MGDPMKALEGAPTAPAAASSWAGSPGAGAAVKTNAPSRINPGRAGRNPAVKKNLALFMA